MGTPITRDMIIEFINENPDKANPACRYFNLDGTPCCLFGHLAEKYGWTELRRSDQGLRIDVISIGLFLEEADRRFAGRVQRRADDKGHLPWGDVLKEVLAEEEAQAVGTDGDR